MRYLFVAMVVMVTGCTGEDAAKRPPVDLILQMHQRDLDEIRRIVTPYQAEILPTKLSTKDSVLILYFSDHQERRTCRRLKKFPEARAALNCESK